MNGRAVARRVLTIKRMKSVIKIGFFVLALALTSCTKRDLMGVFMSFDETPNDRFAESMEYNSYHGYDVITGMPNTYRVYAMSDVHVEGSTHNLDRYVADYLADTTAAPFSLCLGDLIYGNNGFGKFCEHVKPVTDAGRKIYYTVGNHDLYFGQWNDFYTRFGASTYWFEVQKTYLSPLIRGAAPWVWTREIGWKICWKANIIKDIGIS